MIFQLPAIEIEKALQCNGSSLDRSISKVCIQTIKVIDVISPDVDFTEIYRSIDVKQR